MYYVIYGYINFEGYGNEPDYLFVKPFATEKEVIFFDENNDMSKYHIYKIIKGEEVNFNKIKDKTRLEPIEPFKKQLANILKEYDKIPNSKVQDILVEKYNEKKNKNS